MFSDQQQPSELPPKHPSFPPETPPSDHPTPPKLVQLSSSSDRSRNIQQKPFPSSSFPTKAHQPPARTANNNSSESLTSRIKARSSEPDPYCRQESPELRQLIITVTSRFAFWYPELVHIEAIRTRVMTKFELNKLCMDENDSMINAEVRRKHEILLQMQTSWSDRNPGRRFWSCPHYEATNCNFFRWRDKERVDERSRFILPKLVNRIKELEEKYERVKMQLEQLDNFNIEQSKQEKIPLDEGESLRNRYENLNINSKEKGCDVKEMGDLKEKKMKGMKMKNNDEGCR